MLVPGKQFEFDNLFNGDHRRFGPFNLYQAGELSCVNGYEFPPHRQWCHEISYVVSGEGLFTVNGETTVLTEGDVHLCPKDAIHAIQARGGSDLRYAYLGFEFNDDAQGAAFEELRRFFATVGRTHMRDRNNLVIPLLRNLDELYNKSDFYPLMVETYLTQIVVICYRLFHAETQSSYAPALSEDAVGRSVYVIIKYIDNHIFEKIDLGTVAKEVGYNYTYISDMFKRKTGITVQRYICSKKVQKAIELMKYGKLNITQVAQRLDYANIQSFNKAFKRTMGCSPTDYLRQDSAAPVPLPALFTQEPMGETGWPEAERDT